MFECLDKKLSSYKEKINKPAILAFSAGVDSVVLLHFLMQSVLFNQQLTVLYCRHGMRSNAEEKADINLAKTYAKAFSLPFIVENLKANIASSSASETTLYRLRLEAYQKHSKALGIETLFTAHHKDDHLETVLMQLFRGSKTGLKGLQFHQKKMGLNVIKPFLSVTKAMIYQVAQEKKLAYREDSSNKKPINPRNRLRLDIIPNLKEDFPSIQEHIEGFLNYVDTLEKGRVSQEVSTFYEFVKDGVLISKKKVNASFFENQASLGVFFYRLLRELGIEIGHHSVIDRLINCTKQVGKSTQLLCKDWFLQADSDWILIQKGLSSGIKKPFQSQVILNKTINCPAGASFLIKPSVNKNNGCDVLGFDNDLSHLRLRFVRRSDFFCPKGQGRVKKVFDLYKKAQIPALERPFKLVLVDAFETVYWLEDFGCQSIATTGSDQKYTILFKPKISFAKLLL
tara:strand:- start:1917 stop:3284 length:1368 start_codon:yes stop_codon:yes gene_type:complete